MNNNIKIKGLLLFLLLNPSGWTLQIKSSNPVKVKTPLPSCANNSFILQKFAPSTGKNPIYCTSQCVKTPDCRLAGYKDNECQLFRIRVATYFKGDTSPDSFLNDHTCFSLSYTIKDITVQAAISSSPRHQNHPNITDARDGIFCEGHSYKAFSTVGDSTKEYFELKFQSPRMIAQINLQTRETREGFPPMFDDIEIRVGNTERKPGRDFSSNALFDRYPNGPDAPAGKFIEFKGDAPLLGNMISVQKMSASENGAFPLIFQDIQIIEA